MLNVVQFSLCGLTDEFVGSGRARKPLKGHQNVVRSLVTQIHHAVGPLGGRGHRRPFQFHAFRVQRPSHSVVELCYSQIPVRIDFHYFARLPERIAHCFHPFAVALLEVLDFGRVAQDSYEVADVEAEHLHKCRRMEGPSVRASLVLYPNITFVSYTMD